MTAKTYDNTNFRDAQTALQAYWATSGDLYRGEAAEACRKLGTAELKMLAAWVPAGSGLTAVKCTRAREIVNGIIVEKGGK